MKLLLDTHAALWWLAGDARVGANAERQIGDDANRVLLSAAVIWEVAIKRSLGKLRAPAELASTLIGAGAQPLPITLDHAVAVASPRSLRSAARRPGPHGGRRDRLCRPAPGGVRRARALVRAPGPFVGNREDLHVQR